METTLKSSQAHLTLQGVWDWVGTVGKNVTRRDFFQSDETCGGGDFTDLYMCLNS